MKARNKLTILAGASAILGGVYLLRRKRKTKHKSSYAFTPKDSQKLPSKVFKFVDGRVDKMPDLGYLIENDLFYTRPLLSMDSFVKHCNERGISTSKEQLLQFERLGIFYPFARVSPLQMVAWFWGEQTRHLFGTGALWQPSSIPYKKRKAPTVDEEGEKVESYYSSFQLYSLSDLLTAIERSRIKPEKWLTLEKKDARRIVERASRNAEFIFSQHRVRSRVDLAVTICQVISDRYHPYTRSDRRTITVITEEIFDWDEYRRKWNPKAILADIGIDEKTLKSVCYKIIRDRQELDPLEKWRELVNFISVEKKDKLKGHAQLAQSLYSMELMLNLFHKDLTGEGVYLYEQSPEDGDSYYGVGVTENPLEYLEYLSNEYHLNPRPKLILVVEGDGEYETFPKLAARVFSAPFPTLGIEIRKLGGIGGFQKLEKYIDSNHDKQALVFVVLDKEGNVEKIKQALIKKPSELFPKRTVTRDEYVYLWDHSVELDNFTFEEIAQALTQHCENDYVFSAEDVKAAYDKRRGNPLKDLVDEKTGGRRSLNKVTLLDSLFGLILSSTPDEYEKTWAHRPIIKVMDKILSLATFNAQPQYQEAWKEVQESGFFGHVAGKKEAETKDYIEKL